MRICKYQTSKSKRAITPSKTGTLSIKKSQKFQLNYRKVLEEIFDYSDLDGNGFMSRNEFNLFNIRTSGEEVADEEWQVVEGNILYN